MAGRTGVGPRWGNVRTPKTDFANILTLPLTVDCTTKLTDVLRSLTNSVKQHPSYTGRRIEAESHDLSSPRPELEGRTTPESQVPSPVSSKSCLNIQEQSTAPSAYLPFPRTPQTSPLCLALSLVGVVVGVGQISKVTVTPGSREKGQGSIRRDCRTSIVGARGFGQGGQEGAIYTWS